METIDKNKLNPKSEFYSQNLTVTLSHRETINHDSYMFTFSFEHLEEQLGLFVTQHLIIYGQNLLGEVVRRKYTATSPFGHKGSFQIPIKIYRPNVHPHYPEGGELTPWLENLHIGSKLMIKRCIGKLIYLGYGNCLLKPKSNEIPRHFNKILMCCGGTGITPIYQLLLSICSNESDKTEVFLLFANRMEYDILLRAQLELLQSMARHKCKIIYCLENPPFEWTGETGFVNLKMFNTHFPKPNEHTLATLCGPKPMNKLVIGLYKDFGVEESNILKF